MKTLLATIGLVSLALNADQHFAHHHLVVFKDGVEGEPIDTAETEITFDGLAPGVYEVRGYSVDTDGNPMTAERTSGPITIGPDDGDPGDGTTAMVLGSITLSLSDDSDDGTSPRSTGTSVNETNQLASAETKVQEPTTLPGVSGAGTLDDPVKSADVGDNATGVEGSEANPTDVAGVGPSGSTQSPENTSGSTSSGATPVPGPDGKLTPLPSVGPLDNDNVK